MMIPFTRRHPLIVFFVLALGLTWAVEIPMEVLAIAILSLVVGWTPGLAAKLVTVFVYGCDGLRVLLRRILVWRVHPSWYLLAGLGVVPILFAAPALDPLAGGSGLHLPASTPALLALVGVQFAVRMVISGEGLAWRGFALPRLQERNSAFVGSLVLGPSVPAGDQVIFQQLFAGVYVLIGAVVVLVFGPARLSHAPASDALMATSAPLPQWTGPGHGPVRSQLNAR